MSRAGTGRDPPQRVAPVVPMLSSEGLKFRATHSPLLGIGPMFPTILTDHRLNFPSA